MATEYPGLGDWPLTWSDEAQATLLAAGEEARKLGSLCIGTEHLLLALLAQGGILEQIFLDLQVKAPVVRKRIFERDPAGRPPSCNGPLTPHLGEVLHCAVEESRLMGYGPEADNVHLLLGITRLPTCAATVILDLMTLPPKDVREAVFRNLEELDLLPEMILNRNGLP